MNSAGLRGESAAEARRFPAMVRPLRRGSALTLSLTAALAFCSCGEAPPPPIVLISIDTLRADHLPAYGYTRVATPAIDELRRDGMLFERAYAHVPLTLPSHASILTGLLPPGHGVRDNVGYALDAERLAALPGLLRGAGYATGAAVSAFVMRKESGLATGFDFYDDRIETRAAPGLSGIQRSGTDTLAAALPWLRTVANQPFFLLLHVYEPHAPHAPPEPFAARHELPYDGEIAAADAVVGALIAELKRLEVYDRALVVLLSDHGEGLGEHGEHGHGIFLYPQTLKVPLILKLPGRRAAGSTRTELVGLVDVAPTLAVAAGVELPEPRDGRVLLGDGAAGARTRSIYAETYSPRLHFGWSELLALIEDRYLLIDGPDPELYDLDRDPAASVSLTASDRRRVARMRAALNQLRHEPERPQLVDAETRRRLAALGYVGTAGDLDGPLPDPKVMLASLRTMQEGIDHFTAGRFAAAVASLQRAVEENPRMVDGWDYLGRALQRLGRHEEALTAFRHAMRLSGGLPDLAISSALSLLETGRAAEALLVLGAQATRSPEDMRLDFMLVRVLLAEGEVARAAARAEEVLRRSPLEAEARYQRGTVRLAAGDLAGAEHDFRAALELEPDHAATLSDLAVVLVQRGLLSEAGELLRRAVELRPEDAVARANLNRLNSLSNDRRQR